MKLFQQHTLKKRQRIRALTVASLFFVTGCGIPDLLGQHVAGEIHCAAPFPAPISGEEVCAAGYEMTTTGALPENVVTRFRYAPDATIHSGGFSFRLHHSHPIFVGTSRGAVWSGHIAASDLPPELVVPDEDYRRVAASLATGSGGVTGARFTELLLRDGDSVTAYGEVSGENLYLAREEEETPESTLLPQLIAGAMICCGLPLLAGAALLIWFVQRKKRA